MAVKTEGAHTGEFIISLANGDRSREKGRLKTNQSLKDGTVLRVDNTGDLVPATVDESTDGLTSDIVGILFGNWDTTVNGPHGAGDKDGVPYIARDAEVKLAALTYPAESTAGGEREAVVAGLAKLGLIAR